MEKIEQKAYTPSSIGGLQFRIPLYQRPFAWEESQITQLLNDLYEAYTKDPGKHYYIGILNIGSTESVDVYDLIDGQQRITTLTLIGLVLKEFCDDWEKFLVLDRLKLYGRKEDQAYLENLDKSLSPNHKLVDAIKVINQFVTNKSVNQGFSEYVYEHAAFFLSEVPEDYSVMDKNIQFVRMNNRGKQLEVTDILKIKLATVINDGTKRSEFINKWNEISQLGCKDPDDSIGPKSLKVILENQDKSFDNLDKPKESEIFYQSILTFPEFLLIALDRFLKKNKISSSSISYQKDKLLETFWFGEKSISIKWDESSVPEFMKVLEKQYEMFIRFFIRRDKDEKYSYSKPEDEQFVKDNNESLSELLKKILMFQSYLYVSREPQNWMKEAFDWIENKIGHSNDIKTSKLNANDFLTELKQIDNDAHSKDQINATKFTYGSIDRYWFWRLDYYLWENRKSLSDDTGKLFFDANQQIIVEKYVFRKNRSIEHLYPQNDDKQATKWLDKTDVNSFGNLAMISSSFNSTQSDDPVSVKFGRIKDQIDKEKLESIKMYLMYLVANTDDKRWTEKLANEHGAAMIKVIEDSYQYFI